MTDGRFPKSSAEDMVVAAPTALNDDRLFADEIVRRIERLGELHQRLSFSQGTADLAQYLRHIAQSAVASFDVVDRTHLQFEIPQECFVPARMASLVGLAVNELVMNTIQYAHPSGVAGQVFIGCNRKRDTIVIDVADDGIGLPEGFDPRTDGALGLKVVRSLATQLDAKLDFADTGTGLHVRLSVPV